MTPRHAMQDSLSPPSATVAAAAAKVTALK